MAKRKKSSKDKENKRSYPEVYGIILCLIAILGFINNSGPVGKFIKSFAVFLFGSAYAVLLLCIFIGGVLLFFKNKKPNFLKSRVCGALLVLIMVLVLLHTGYITGEKITASGIISNTFDNLMDTLDVIINTGGDTDLSNLGGGMVGGLSLSLIYALFKGATKIVTIIIGIIGFLIFTGLSIMDILNKGKDMLPKKKNKEGSIKPLIVDNNDNGEKKIVIQNLDEITKVHDDKNVEPKKENIPTNKDYHLPNLSLLDWPNKNKSSVDKSVIEKNIGILENTLNEFGIVGKVVEVNIGPTVTQYEMELKSGTKVSKLLGINREIALALAKKNVRIQAPIPGKNTVGVEMPNESTQLVSIREVLEAMPKRYDNSKLAVVFGKNIMGKCEYGELNKMPHLLVAGATGSGKSVCINCMLISILMRTKPDEVKLVLVDPKKVELSIYNGVPHLLTPVVSDPRKASDALKKIVMEMERRYELFSETGSKNMESYNEMIENKNKHLSDDEKMKKLPYIVCVIDELADLMLVAAKEVEDSIMRITQMARAAGIHLVVATQRPSTDVVTGLIKANIPSRIAFAVSSSIDSRTILDMMGAEKLLGKGDMLFLPMGESTPLRIQGSFVSEQEIKRVVDHTVKEQIAQYDENFLSLSDNNSNMSTSSSSAETEEYDDPLYNEIVEYIITTGKVSASLLQRKYRLGYNRAARIVDLLEERGIIGPANGSKPREVLVQLEKDE
ncbi:MAG TPA: DNA translocase FtsK [Bacilli bacterium]|nr:DNA translocase FtsK [Bacilli bacterium]